jgi:hypothetical protein
VKEAFNKFFTGRRAAACKEMENQRRHTLFSELWSCAKTMQAPWIGTALRLLWAIPCKSVCCERDFAWLQHILTEKRLAMGRRMVIAYMLARLVPNVFGIAKRESDPAPVAPGRQRRLDEYPGFKNASAVLDRVRVQVMPSSSTRRATKPAHPKPPAASTQELAGVSNAVPQQPSSSPQPLQPSSAPSPVVLNAVVTTGSLASEPSSSAQTGPDEPRRSQRVRRHTAVYEAFLTHKQAMDRFLAATYGDELIGFEDGKKILSDAELNAALVVDDAEEGVDDEGKESDDDDEVDGQDDARDVETRMVNEHTDKSTGGIDE